MPCRVFGAYVVKGGLSSEPDATARISSAPRLRRIDRQHDNKSVNLGGEKDMADNPLFPGGDVYGDESIQSSGSADAGSGARRNRLLFSVSTV